MFRFFLFCCFLVLLLGVEGFFVASAQTMPEVITTDMTWHEDRVVTAPVIVMEGATLTIMAGVTVTFDDGINTPQIASPTGIAVLDGALYAHGTATAPISFVRSNDDRFFVLSFGNGGEDVEEQRSFLRHVIIDGGGVGQADPGELPFLVQLFLPVAWAQGIQEMITRYGAVHIMNGFVHIENSTIKNSRFAAVYYNDGDAEVVNSIFEGNEETAVSDKEITDDGVSLILNHNWYDQVIFRGTDTITEMQRRLTRTIVDPVIVVPGLFGSFTSHGVWKIDPIFRTYDNLVASFGVNGYHDEYVATLPYNWHASNDVTADLLAEKIAEVTHATDLSQVDVVAHSMGGLVARSYIQSDAYRGDVDQLITIATPHLGAPKSYLLWEAGEFPTEFSVGGLANKIVKEVVQYLAEENGYESIFDYVRSVPVLSVRDLLPTYAYLHDAQLSDEPLRDEFPANHFLENLNAVSNVEKLARVEFSKIIGDKGDDGGTIAGFNVLQHDYPDGRWEHGRPIGFEFQWVSDGGLRYTTGDETVPLISAVSSDIFSQDTTILNAEHREIVTASIPKVIEILTRRESIDMTNLVPEIEKMILVRMHSPADFLVTAPDGQRVGTDGAAGTERNEIDGAFYTGNGDDIEFLTIPNPQDGEYTITTIGTGDGEYTVDVILVAVASDNSIETSAYTTTGIATDGVVAAHTFSLDDDVVSDPAIENINDDSEDIIVEVAVEDAADEDDDDEDNKKKKKKKKDATDNVLVVTKSIPQKNVSVFDSEVRQRPDKIAALPPQAEREDVVADVGHVAGVSASTSIRWWVFGIIGISGIGIVACIVFLRRKSV